MMIAPNEPTSDLASSHCNVIAIQTMEFVNAQLKNFGVPLSPGVKVMFIDNCRVDAMERGNVRIHLIFTKKQKDAV